jgi:drug/metabolite transporter (DMT)-like permease
VDLRRLRAGEWLALAAGITLIVSLFLPWYETDDGDVSGFAVMSVIDILLVLVAAVGITLAVLQATQTTQTLPVGFGVLTVVTGAIGTLLTLFRLIDSPGAGDVSWGAWLGLVAVVALTVGGWRSIANEHVRHLPPGPEPERRPAPTGS